MWSFQLTDWTTFPREGFASRPRQNARTPRNGHGWPITLPWG
jgi:hypothetical protein